MKSLLMAVLTLTLMVGCKKSKIDVDDDNIGGADQQAVILEPILDNLPKGESRLTRINIRVQGLNIANYIYKIGVAAKLDCTNPTGYSLNAVGTPIDQDISSLPDGPVALCLVAQHDNAVWQAYDTAKRFEWQKSTGALPSVANLRAIHGSQQLTLFWDDASEGEGYLAIRQLLKGDWKPTDGTIYEVGQALEGGGFILASGPGSTLVDAGLQNDNSYHYSIYTYDSARRYSPAATIAGIPSVASYTWLALKPGAYLENAVVAGTRYDGSSELYICRGKQRNPADQIIARLPGKFVPAKKGDPSVGSCYVPDNRSVTDIEILVVTDGSFAEVLEWTFHASSSEVPGRAIIGGNDLDAQLFVCRFKSSGNYYTPGSHALNEACKVDAFGAANNTANSFGFEILSSRPI